MSKRIVIFIFMISLGFMQSINAQSVRRFVVTPDLVSQIIEGYGTEFSQIHTRILADEIRLSGIYNNQLLVVFTASPLIQDDRLVITISSLSVDNELVADEALIESMETTINQILLSFQSELTVVEFELQAGELIIQYIRNETEVVPVDIDVRSELNNLFSTSLPQCGNSTETTITNAPMAESDRRLLDEAVTRVENANNLMLRISFYGCIADNDEIMELQVSSRGIIANFNDLESLQLDQTMTVNILYNTELLQTVIVEYRIVEGIAYFSGYEPSTERRTRWISIPLINLLEETLALSTIPATDIFNPLAMTGSEPNLFLSETLLESGLASGLLEFGDFIYTARTDIGAVDEAQYTTVFDINGLLGSESFINTVLRLMSLFGAIPIDNNIELISGLFVSARSLIIPYVTISIDRFIEIDNATMTSIVLNGDLGVDLSLFLQDMDPLNMHVDAYADIVGYNLDTAVEIPEDAYEVTDFDEINVDDVMILPEE